MSAPATLRQWDVIRARIVPTDKDEHPAVIISPNDICARPGSVVNVLYCTTLRPGTEAGAHNVRLNGADDLDHATLVNCAMQYRVSRDRITHHYGSVSAPRRREIGR
jgi:mRNA-degrading endonuclease toxin of MazEF toxin-antitoxin module